jgi:hypothetical protein
MTKINDVLAVLRDKLEEVLQLEQSQAEPWVLLGNVALRDETGAREVNNKMVMSLVSLQSDASTSAFVAPQLAGDERYYLSPPPLHLDAYVMICAHFTEQNYEAGLARLSSTLSFFQQMPVLTRENTPQLPSQLDKLVVEFVSLDFGQMSHLLTAAGGGLAPFALYRLRRLPFDAAAAVSVAPAVRSGERSAETH